MKRIVVTFLLLGTFTLVAYAQDKVTKKDPPKEIGFTQIQKLQAENLDLKRTLLKKELEEVEKAYVEIIKGVFEGAGIPKAEWNDWKIDVQKYVLIKPDKPKETAEKK